MLIILVSVIGVAAAPRNTLRGCSGTAGAMPGRVHDIDTTLTAIA
ncbi:hypothetical protein [Parahaliea mediterranea]|nr:hypothetical protein [Parahaliea mediterranea]